MARKFNRRIRQTLLTALGACLVGYFLYHTLQGERGVLAMMRTQKQVVAARETLSTLQKDRAELEHRTQLLHANSLDPDLLEEKSRELLNYSKPNEIVIMLPKEEKQTEENATPAAPSLPAAVPPLPSTN